MKLAAVIAAALCVVQGGMAHAVRLSIDPAAIGIERLDRAWESSGLESRTAPRIGFGTALDFGHGLGIGAGLATAAGTTTFGLLSGPSARLVRTEATLELRARAPIEWHGIGLRGVVGGGRLRIAWRPDRVVLDTTSGGVAVDLTPVHAWTRHLAAEVLHSWGPSTLALRAGWRWYALDVATPDGTSRQAMRDAVVAIVIAAKLR